MLLPVLRLGQQPVAKCDDLRRFGFFLGRQADQVVSGVQFDARRETAPFTVVNDGLVIGTLETDTAFPAATGAPITFKAWVCSNPDCGFNIRIDNGEINFGRPLGQSHK